MRAAAEAVAADAVYPPHCTGEHDAPRVDASDPHQQQAEQEEEEEDGDSSETQMTFGQKSGMAHT